MTKICISLITVLLCITAKPWLKPCLAIPLCLSKHSVLLQPIYFFCIFDFPCPELLRLPAVRFLCASNCRLVCQSGLINGFHLHPVRKIHAFASHSNSEKLYFYRSICIESSLHLTQPSYILVIESKWEFNAFVFLNIATQIAVTQIRLNNPDGTVHYLDNMHALEG